MPEIVDEMPLKWASKYPPPPAEGGVRFRLLDEFPGHCVGDDGSVWSCLAGRGWRKRKAVPTGKGRYAGVLLRDAAGKPHLRYVHRLVLEAFVGPCPAGMEGCHYPDRDRMNNRLGNLRWDTPAANNADKLFHGTDFRGEKNPSARLTAESVREIRRRYEDGGDINSIAGATGLSYRHVWEIVRRRRWKHV